MEESKIIDYLYGNASEQEQREMEEAIKNDNQLKAEIDSLAHLRTFVSNLEDKEVIAPSFVFESEADGIIAFHKTGFFKKLMSIAAGLALIITTAYLTGFEMSYSENGLLIGFSTQSRADDKQEMRAMMKELLAENQVETHKRINSVESKLAERIALASKSNMDSMQQVLASNTNYSKGLMKAYIEQVNNENLDMIQNFFVVSTTQQQKYLKTVLSDFNDFYQTQRESDLKMIEAGLNDIQDNNEIKQYETDVVLANLMDIVQVKNK